MTLVGDPAEHSRRADKGGVVEHGTLEQRHGALVVILFEALGRVLEQVALLAPHAQQVDVLNVGAAQARDGLHDFLLGDLVAERDVADE